MTDYIIPTEGGDEHRRLSIAWSRDRSIIYFRLNGGGTASISAATALNISNGIRALLSGHFDRAISETELRLEAEEVAYRQSRRTEPSRSDSSSNPKPELDQL